MSENVVQFGISPEGYVGQEKKDFSKDPWIEIFRARQNGNILQNVVTAVEYHNVNGEPMPCLIVMHGHVKGLIPKPFSGCNTERQMKKMIGQVISYKIIGLDRDSSLIHLSREAALEEMQKKTWEKIKVDDEVLAIARQVHPHKAILNVGGIECELLAKEVAHGWVNNVKDYIKVGDAFNVKVMKVDKQEKKIEVSLKALIKSPYPDCLKRYHVNNNYLGTVTGIVEYGIFVNLEPGVDTLCKHMRYGNPYIGQKVIVIVKKIDPEKEEIRSVIWRKLD